MACQGPRLCWLIFSLLFVLPTGFAKALWYNHNEMSGHLVYNPPLRVGTCNQTGTDTWWEYCAYGSAHHTAITNGPSSTVTLTFQGHTIEYWGIGSLTNGKALISLDGAPSVEIDTARTPKNPIDELYWNAANLDETKAHTVTLRSGSPYNANNPKFIHLHRFMVFQSDGLETMNLLNPTVTTAGPTTPPPTSTPETTEQKPTTPPTQDNSTPSTQSQSQSQSDSLSLSSPVSEGGAVTVYVQSNTTASPTPSQSSALTSVTNSTNDASPSIGVIVGGVSAGFVLLGLLIVAMIFYYRRKRALAEGDSESDAPQSLILPAAPQIHSTVPAFPVRRKGAMDLYQPHVEGPAAATPPTASSSRLSSSVPSSPTQMSEASFWREQYMRSVGHATPLFASPVPLRDPGLPRSFSPPPEYAPPTTSPIVGLSFASTTSNSDFDTQQR